jgi:hypothetical protein
MAIMEQDQTTQSFANSHFLSRSFFRGEAIKKGRREKIPDFLYVHAHVNGRKKSMDALRSFLIFTLILASIGSAWGLKITYNTTVPIQFVGEDSFENLNEVRVVFRADPISIQPGESTNLSFVAENPTDTEHLISITLIEIPSEFKVIGAEMEIEKRVQNKSREKLIFTLKAPEGIKPRTYYYGFDVVDITFDDDQKVAKTSKRLGTYNGLNVVEPGITENVESEDVESLGKEEKGKGLRPPTSKVVSIFVVALILLSLILINKIKR